jgi:hypothetical protein
MTTGRCNPPGTATASISWAPAPPSGQELRDAWRSAKPGPRPLRWLPESLVVLADAYERAAQTSGSEVQFAVTCSSEEELEHIADALGVEVQTQSGARLAVREGQFGAPRIVATFKPSAGTSGDSREALPASRRSGWPLAMVMREVRQALGTSRQAFTGRTDCAGARCSTRMGRRRDCARWPPPWDPSRGPKAARTAGGRP